MRPCGCDVDVRVFGHNYCFQQPFTYGKHLVCTCTACTCDCHKDG